MTHLVLAAGLRLPLLCWPHCVAHTPGGTLGRYGTWYMVDIVDSRYSRYSRYLDARYPDRSPARSPSWPARALARGSCSAADLQTASGPPPLEAAAAGDLRGGGRSGWRILRPAGGPGRGRAAWPPPSPPRSPPRCPASAAAAGSWRQTNELGARGHVTSSPPITAHLMTVQR